MKALSAELEIGFNKDEMAEPILDEIIQNIPSKNSTSITAPSTHTIDTLHLEFDGILQR